MHFLHRLAHVFVRFFHRIELLLLLRREQWADLRAARLNGERPLRLVISLLLLIPIGAYLWYWQRRGWAWRAPLIGTLFYFALWSLAYFGLQRMYFSIFQIKRS